MTYAEKIKLANEHIRRLSELNKTPLGSTRWLELERELFSRESGCLPLPKSK